MTTTDGPYDSDALNAAYDALIPHTQHAQVRADIAERIVAHLLGLRRIHGIGYMLQVAQDEHILTGVSGELLIRAPATYTPLPRRVWDDAVRAAAAELAEG